MSGAGRWRGSGPAGCAGRPPASTATTEARCSAALCRTARVVSRTSGLYITSERRSTAWFAMRFPAVLCGQVCPSCRAFFRRSVQSGYNATYYCVKEGSCEVRISALYCAALHSPAGHAEDQEELPVLPLPPVRGCRHEDCLGPHRGGTQTKVCRER